MMNSMTKQPPANQKKQSSRLLSPLTLTLVSIASVIAAIIFYAVIMAALGALDESSMGEGMQAIVFIGLLLAMVLGPSIIVAVIVVPILKRSQKR